MAGPLRRIKIKISYEKKNEKSLEWEWNATMVGTPVTPAVETSIANSNRRKFFIKRPGLTLVAEPFPNPYRKKH